MTNTIDPISYNAEQIVTDDMIRAGRQASRSHGAGAMREIYLAMSRAAPADAERLALASEPQHIEWTDTEVIFGRVRLPRSTPEAFDLTGKGTVEKAVHAFVQSFGPNWRSVPLWIKAEIARAIAAAAVPFSDDYNAAQNAAEHWMAKAHDLDASHRAGGWREDMVARPIAEYHEDMGDVLWWKFPITEAPYVGGPNDLGQTIEIAVMACGVTKTRAYVGGWPGDHTHFTPIPNSLRPEEHRRLTS